MPRSAKKKDQKAQEAPFRLPPSIRYDEDFTEEEWQYILKRSRELIPDLDEYIPVGEPGW